MPGRYAGVVGKRLTGDALRASELVPLARKLAQQALDTVDFFGGSGAFVVSEITPDGARVVAWAAASPPNPPIVRVSVYAPIAKPEVPTPDERTTLTLTWFAEGFSITPQTTDAPLGWGLPRLDASGNPINAGKGTLGGPIRDVLINNFEHNGYPATTDQPVLSKEDLALVPYANAPLLATTDWPQRDRMTAYVDSELQWFCHWQQHVGDPRLSGDIRRAINAYRNTENADLVDDYPPIRGYYRHFAELWIATNTPDYEHLFPLIAHQDDLFPDRLHAIHNRGNRCGRYAFADYSEIILLGASGWTAQDRVDMWKTSPVHDEDMLWPHTAVELNNIHPHIEVVRAAADPEKQSPYRAAFSEVATGSKDGQSLSVRTIDVRDKFVETGNLYWTGAAGTVSWHSPFGSKHHLYPLTETVDDPDTGDPSVADLSKYYAFRGGQVMSHAKPYFLYRGHASGIPEELVTVKLGASGTEADTIWPHTTTWVVIGACLLDEPVPEPDLSALFDDLRAPYSDPLDPVKLKFALALYLNVITGELRLYKGSVSRFEVAERVQTLAAPDFYQPMTERNEFFGEAESADGLAQYQKHCAHDILGISACTFNSTGTEGVFVVHRIDHNIGTSLVRATDEYLPQDIYTATDKLHWDSAPQGSRIEFITVTQEAFSTVKTSVASVTPAMNPAPDPGDPPATPITIQNYELAGAGTYSLFVDYNAEDELVYADVSFSFLSADSRSGVGAEDSVFAYTGTLSLPCGNIPFVNVDGVLDPFFVNINHINLFEWGRCVYTKISWVDTPVGDIGEYYYVNRAYSAVTYIGDNVLYTHTNIGHPVDIPIYTSEAERLHPTGGVVRELRTFFPLGWGRKNHNPHMFWQYPGQAESWYASSMAFMPEEGFLGDFAATRMLRMSGRTILMEYAEGDMMVPSIAYPESTALEAFNVGLCPFATSQSAGSVNRLYHVAYNPLVVVGPSMISSMMRDPRDVVGCLPSITGTGFIQEIAYNDDWILAGWIGNPFGIDVDADGNAIAPYAYEFINADGTPWSGTGYPLVRYKYEDHAASVSTFGTDRCFWRSSLDLEAIVGEGELINILPIGVA